MRIGIRVQGISWNKRAEECCEEWVREPCVKRVVQHMNTLHYLELDAIPAHE